MQETTFLTLTALAAGSQHGYGIASDVPAISEGHVRLRAGTPPTRIASRRASPSPPRAPLPNPGRLPCRPREKFTCPIFQSALRGYHVPEGTNVTGPTACSSTPSHS